MTQWIARAPARLDVMGGIADYSGSLVLELPLDVATTVTVALTDDHRVAVTSPAVAELGAEPVVSVPVASLAPDGVPLDYDAARTLLGTHASSRWAAYVIGTLVVLAREKGATMRGVSLHVASTVPLGKGVSSSAALEVASMQALAAALGVTLDGRELALLCQRAENLVVGAPCGVMDQMTAACGQRDRLLALRCQPAEIEAQVLVPPGLALWGIDSGIRHEVSGADYGSVRVGAFMGQRILTELAGEAAATRWNGYLANVTPFEWAAYRDAVPESLGGAEFLARYGSTADVVTRVDPSRTYAVRLPAEHPILEHHRVRLFRALLAMPSLDDERCALLGELMYQAHASYSALGIGSSGTDHLVAIARATPGVFGAKITGGGSGGVVAVLARADAAEAVHAIAERYASKHGRGGTVLGGSSAGAAAHGVRRVEATG